MVHGQTFVFSWYIAHVVIITCKTWWERFLTQEASTLTRWMLKKLNSNHLKVFGEHCSIVSTTSRNEYTIKNGFLYVGFWRKKSKKKLKFSTNMVTKHIKIWSFSNCFLTNVRIDWRCNFVEQKKSVVFSNHTSANIYWLVILARSVFQFSTT